MWFINSSQQELDNLIIEHGIKYLSKELLIILKMEKNED